MVKGHLREINLAEFSPKAREKVQELKLEVIDPYLQQLKEANLSSQFNYRAERTYSSLRKYGMAHTLHEAGVPINKIIEKTNETRKVITGWLCEGKLPQDISYCTKERRSHYEKVLSIPYFEPSADFAYFLGAYAASTKSGNLKQQLRFSTIDLEVAEKLCTVWDSFCCTPLNSPNRKLSKVRPDDVPLWEVRALSEPLLRYINKLTCCNTTLPWEHLVTENERLTFLRGCFDWNGYLGNGTTNKNIFFQRTNGESLIVEISIMLNKLGISPRVHPGAKANLAISDFRDVKLFRELIGLTAQRQQNRLDVICGRKVNQASYSIDDYTKVLRYREMHPDESLLEVSRRTEMPYDQVRGWLVLDMKPKSVLRHEEIESHASKLPDFDLIGKIHREHKLDAGRARKLVSRLSAEEIDNHLNIEKSKKKPVTIEQLADQILVNGLAKRFRDAIPPPILEMRGFFRECIIAALDENDCNVMHGKRELRELLNFHLSRKR